MNADQQRLLHEINYCTADWKALPSDAADRYMALVSVTGSQDHYPAARAFADARPGYEWAEHSLDRVTGGDHGLDVAVIMWDRGTDAVDGRIPDSALDVLQGHREQLIEQFEQRYRLHPPATPDAPKADGLDWDAAHPTPDYPVPSISDGEVEQLLDLARPFGADDAAGNGPARGVDAMAGIQPVNAVAEARLRTLRVSQWCARVLVLAAFALSSVALCELAIAAHLPPWLAWLWPLCVDGSIYQAASAVSALAGRTDAAAMRARRWFQWVIGGGVTVSVLANGLHAWTIIGHQLTWWQVTAVAVVPPVLLLVATHGVTILAGVDVVAEQADAELGEVEPGEVELHRVTVERVEPVAEVEQPSAPELPAAVEPQVSIEPAAAGHPPRRPATQRDPGKVLAAQQLAAKAVPMDEIAARLEVSKRTVRRYLQVEVTETTEAVERPQLFAVGDRGQGLEVVNG